MSGQHLRGQGYQKKGGRAATAAHNERVRAAAASATPDSAHRTGQPRTADHGTDGRASGRSAHGRTARMRDRLALVAVSAVSGAAVVVVLERLA